VVDPPRPLAVDQPPYPGGEKAMTERKRFLQALATRTIEPEVSGRRTEANKETASSQQLRPQSGNTDY
jgi:hypothetical protein